MPSSKVLICWQVGLKWLLLGWINQFVHCWSIVKDKCHNFRRVSDKRIKLHFIESLGLNFLFRWFWSISVFGFRLFWFCWVQSNLFWVQSEKSKPEKSSPVETKKMGYIFLVWLAGSRWSIDSNRTGSNLCASESCLENF